MVELDVPTVNQVDPIYAQQEVDYFDPCFDMRVDDVPYKGNIEDDYGVNIQIEYGSNVKGNLASNLDDVDKQELIDDIM